MTLSPEFKGVEVYPLLSSEDRLSQSPEFGYGSMADGMGLMRNTDGTFTLINNIEANYAIARITFDESFAPIKGEHIFKTPTLRNSDLTAPYMHNGVYAGLEEVLDFYNRGGGAGIGIQQEHQTLPQDALSLKQEEIRDIIAFLEALTDQEAASRQ